MTTHETAGPDSYATVAEGRGAEIKVKGSRFVGQAFSIKEEADVRKTLDKVLRQHHKASHHCWAARLAPPESPTERCDDDGEPAGTAGQPILAICRGAELLDLLLVVTRYFGGTKLGKGGLVKAYGDAAREALAATTRRTEWLDVRIVIACTYDDVGSVEAVLSRNSEAIAAAGRAFSERPGFTLRVRRSRAEGLIALIRDATSGRAKARICAGDEP